MKLTLIVLLAFIAVSFTPSKKPPRSYTDCAATEEGMLNLQAKWRPPYGITNFNIESGQQSMGCAGCGVRWCFTATW